MVFKPIITTIICFVVFLVLLLMACSNINSADEPTLSESNSEVTSVANVALAKHTRSTCSDSNEYSFPMVENPGRRQVPDSPMPKDLEIRVGKDIAAKIELPVADWEVKNFSVLSVKRTKNGFDAMVEWGGGNYHHEIQFRFNCKKNELFLYKVIHTNFSTTVPGSGNLWDRKEVKEIAVEPNVSIENFKMLKYLD